MATPDLSHPDYWNDLYRASDTGWDKGRPAPPLVRLLADSPVRRGAPLVVLGAGRGHDALEAARNGYVVTAVDFAEEAVKAIRAASRDQAIPLEALQQDVFLLAQSHPGAFEGALEHTSFCAIDPSRRAEYAQMVHAVLRPGGVFFGLFYAHGRPGGPPCTTDEGELRGLFAPLFEIERLTTAADSFPNRAGNELEFLFRRR
ncbi:MAG: TPMT family class I SAM-dependent methyltransferase [Myxococcota bacterium]|nr:TPMT family class I SAM-dependent methyltransferase [Myxococcota bacterium]